MQYYYAPMEGVTDSVYRQLHHQFFPGVDSYFMPFLSPTVHRDLTPREQRELPFADTVDFRAVPQLLTKVAEDFIWAAGQCCDRGYDEVNLNLGCPSGTVTGKGKGSGMLRDPDTLRRFLDGIFASAPLPISVKTRLGYIDPEEFPRLLDIFNDYPIQELIVHPRVRQAFYAGSVDLDSFRYALEHSRAPVCYNGNLNSVEDIHAFSAAFPQVQTVMLGRGLVGDPGMLSPGGTTVQLLDQFLDALLNEYTATFGGSRNAMFRMKENWHYLICRFDGGEKIYKQLRKTTDEQQFRQLTHQLMAEVPLADKLHPDW